MGNFASKYIIANFDGKPNTPAVFETLGYDPASETLFCQCLTPPNVHRESSIRGVHNILGKYASREIAFVAWRQLVSAPTESSPDALRDNPILRFFHYSHLPQPLAVLSAPFCALAHRIVAETPPSAERTACLRKLLEAKDCAVRASLPTAGEVL